MKNQINLNPPEIKQAKRNFLESENIISSFKKYCDYDDTEPQEIRDIGNLFDEINEDY